MPSKLEGVLSAMLGNLGMPDVQVGRHVVKAAPRESDESLKGYGDTVRVGDFVRTRRIKGGQPKATSETIYRIEALRRDDKCPQVQLFPINNLECVHTYPLMQYVRSPQFPRDGIDFVLVTQADVEEWWERRRLGPGWHLTDTPTDSVRVFVDEDGTPLKVHRGHCHRNMEESRRWAEVVTGYDLKLRSRYEDAKKLIRVVRHARRKAAPRVPRDL